MDENLNLAAVYDLVIVGSGGGSMAAALVAKSLGKSAVIFEKQACIGGSTAYSGGVWWVPNNPLLAETGIADSYEKSREYFDSVVTYRGPAVTAQRRDAFLKAGPHMVTFLRGLGMKFRRPYEDWPDYYDELPGGLPEGRSLLAEPFNLRELGPWKEHLAIYGPLEYMPISAEEFTTLFLLKRTFRGKVKAVKYAWLMMRDKLTGRQTVTNGGAIQGRMLQIGLREGLQIFRNTPVKSLLLEKDRVAGVVVQHDGRAVEVRARGGVIVNAGGYAHNEEFRRVHGREPVREEWTNANPGDTGEILQLMMDLGAATDCLDAAWWVITSQNVNGDWPEGAVWPGGRVYRFMHHLDLSLPHSIMVDHDGCRFCNEAGAYMEIGERMLDRHRETGRAVPAWVVFDKRHRDWYPWGTQPPGKTPRSWIESGYMKKSDTLDELATQCGIDTTGLRAQVDRYNGYCRTGHDPEFNRGGRAFDRTHGDPTVTPNPNLGPIEQGPFYAVAMYPADVGTAGGVVTDEFARVKRQDGRIIEGLYAIGNAAAPIFGRCYPGAGASIGASFTFGFIAAHHSAGSSTLAELLA
ncbi:MAG: FAD-binding protein [Rhodospirillaceae bacterium]|nr:MAG: FAD-binding protein [Rhodospirillaceae bacterium]